MLFRSLEENVVLGVCLNRRVGLLLYLNSLFKFSADERWVPVLNDSLFPLLNHLIFSRKRLLLGSDRSNFLFSKTQSAFLHLGRRLYFALALLLI